MIGGIAVIARGVPRLTRDIDIAVAGTEITSSVLADELGRVGIHPRIADAVAFADENQVLLMEHAESGSRSMSRVRGSRSRWRLSRRRRIARILPTAAKGDLRTKQDDVEEREDKDPHSAAQGEARILWWSARGGERRERRASIASAWRPTLRKIVKAFVRGDYALAHKIESVAPVSKSSASQIRAYVAEYGETLVALPDDTGQHPCLSGWRDSGRYLSISGPPKVVRATWSCVVHGS